MVVLQCQLLHRSGCCVARTIDRICNMLMQSYQVDGWQKRLSV